MMSDLPPLTIMLLTCDRWDYARKTLASTLRNLRYSGEVYVHVADDSRGENGPYEINQLLGLMHPGDAGRRTSTRTGGHSYGRSYNLATQVIHKRGGVVLVLEDDWELMYPLDADRLVRALHDDLSLLGKPRIGCIRLGYLGWTQPLFGALVSVNDETLLYLDRDSPERHVFAGHPRIETVDWQRVQGPWPEGLAAGATEFEVAGRVRTGIAWPMWLQPGGVFGHIGTRRARED